MRTWYAPSPRPNAANIKGKFEQGFKGRDESKVNSVRPLPGDKFLIAQMPLFSEFWERAYRALT
jgi:hypothetical protein